MKNKNLHNDDYLKYDSSIGKWCNKVIDKEFIQNKKKYCSDGSFGFGASITIAKRIEKSFNETKDKNKKDFLSKCANWLNHNIFD